MKEKEIESCAYLLMKLRDLAQRQSSAERDGMLFFAIRDFNSKVRVLPTDVREQFAARALAALSPISPDEPIRHDLVGLLSSPSTDANGGAGPSKKRADVIVLTVIEVEMTAVLKAFGLSPDSESVFQIGGRDVFVARLQRDSRWGGTDLTVFITMVGEPRNVPCANVCRDMLEAVDTDLVILCGIAGGDSSSVKQGDVIGVREVFYTEGGERIEKKKLLGLVSRTEVEPEVTSEKLRPHSRKRLQHFRYKKSSTIGQMHAVLGTYTLDQVDGSDVGVSNEMRFHKECIMCGEKVVADDGIKVAAGFNRKIYAVDMESYGLAYTCNYLSKEWMVFRGISDYANPKKDDKRHVPASIAAAVLAKNFLAESYSSPSEPLPL